ncbi:phosphomevalonate kinase [Streptomyces zingiberis]|uniref:phosphomevalonate kinase n=1 Tax=Streptomyces zingiberis TaxID=2053010 RepID=A0ABX1BVP0_9ACTN|nr:phosphomevalonate kinase [Streptomyces zingiberis]NJQ01133.1 phosphomevalonate kinase [Streptomyces zingiberis]
MARRVTRRAPGKLLVAGEYAVLEPGRPAVVVAVDRYVTVTAGDADGTVRTDHPAHPGSPAETAGSAPCGDAPASPGPGTADVIVDSDLVGHEVGLRRTPEGLRVLPGQGFPATAAVPAVLAHVVSAVETVEALAEAAPVGRRPLGPAAVRLTIRSDLHDGGVKTGLGSSAAVTVATVRALAEYHGTPLPDRECLRVALLAGVRVNAGPSGADLAAAACGGWVAYRAPDRRALLAGVRRDGVAATLAAPWPGFAVRPLPPPSGVTLHVGWSGSPASTPDLVAGLTAGPWWHSDARGRFLDDSEDCVTRMVRALEDDRPADLLASVRTARRLLDRLDGEAAQGVVTEPLRRLCEVAEACGAAAKPSGAGGGDCGIALLPGDGSAASAAPLHRRWREAGITPLPLAVAAGAGAATAPAPAGPSAPAAGSARPALSARSAPSAGSARSAPRAEAHPAGTGPQAGLPSPTPRGRIR